MYSQGLHDLAAHTAWEVDTCSLDLGTRVGEHLQRRRVVANLDAHLVEDGLGIVLDGLQALVADDLERFHRPGEIGLGLDDM